MLKRFFGLSLLILLLPVFFVSLSQDGGGGESQETVYYNALVSTVRIHHTSPYTTHYQTTDTDVTGGSGILLDNGLVLTCYHVLAGYQAGEISIYRFTKDKTEVRRGTEISIVAFSKPEDLLLLQVNPPFDPPFIKVAMATPMIGARTIITGHTQLRVTRLRLYQYLEGSMGILVTPVFFGDSGGGVFNEQGELVGIIRLCLTMKEPIIQSTLYGYATPLPIIKEFLDARPRQN